MRSARMVVVMASYQPTGQSTTIIAMTPALGFPFAMDSTNGSTRVLTLRTSRFESLKMYAPWRVYEYVCGAGLRCSFTPRLLAGDTRRLPRACVATKGLVTSCFSSTGEVVHSRSDTRELVVDNKVTCDEIQSMVVGGFPLSKLNGRRKVGRNAVLVGSGRLLGQRDRYLRVCVGELMIPTVVLMW